MFYPLFYMQILHCSYISSECILVYYVYVSIYISSLFFLNLRLTILYSYGAKVVFWEKVYILYQILPLTCQVSNFPLCPSPIPLPHLGSLGCTQHLSSINLLGLPDIIIKHKLQTNYVWKPFFCSSTRGILSCLLDFSVLQLQAVWNIAPFTCLKELYVSHSRWIYRSKVFCNVTSFNPSRLPEFNIIEVISVGNKINNVIQDLWAHLEHEYKQSYFG